MNSDLVQQWYEQYKTGIFRFALSILKDSHLAEDFLQEVFVRLLSGKCMVQEGKQQAWLYKVARNLSYDLLRKRNREAEQVAVQNWESYEYIDLIAGLDLTEREIVTLKIVCWLTHNEIAKVMGISVQAAKKRYERIIQKMREEEL